MRTLRSLPIVQNVAGMVHVRDLAVSQGFTAPIISLTKFAQQLAVKTFEAVVTTPDPESLGGSVHLTIHGDGKYELKVHMHDSGVPDYSFRLGIFLRSASGLVLALYSSGTVHGTDYAVLRPTATGFREFDDTQTGVYEAISEDGWGDFSAGTLQVNREWKNNLTEWATSTYLERLNFIVSVLTLGAPAAMLIWEAGQVADLEKIRLPGELGLTGIVAAEGAFLLAGPGFFVPVFIAGALVSAVAFQRRRLSTEERTELNKVFAYQSPSGETEYSLDYDSIWITNLDGLDGRAFTVFNLNEEIVLAAASKTFPDFKNLLNDDKGPNNLMKRTFIHEMTHAWQYQKRRFWTRISQIIDTRREEAADGQNATYNYQVGLDWDQYNMEQQAEVVADWYSMKFNNYPPDPKNTPPKGTDVTNLRYIQQNILMDQA